MESSPHSAASSVAQAPNMLPKQEQEAMSVDAKGEVEDENKEKKESEEKPLKRSSIELLEEAQNEKFKRYEAECTQYLMSKYFSDKTIFGGNIFDVKMTIDGEPIKVSRFPGYLSYADPANFQEESNSCASTPACSANGNHQPSGNGN